MNALPDQPISVWLPILEYAESRFAAVCLAWTCPVDGERIIYPVPNVYKPGEYMHQVKRDGTRCGHNYTGELFGLVVLFPPFFPAPPGAAPRSSS